MPQNQSVDQILAGAKAELGKANAMSATLPKAATPAPKPVAPKPIAPKASLKNELDAKGQMVGQAKKALEGTGVVPKMHRGGPVMADGVYQLQKGEHVLTAPEAARAKKHALMHAGMRSLANMGIKQSKEATSGEPSKMDKPAAGHTVSVRHISVRPEMNQGAKSAHTEGNKMPTMRGSRGHQGVTHPMGHSTTNAMSKIRPEGTIKRDTASVVKP